MNQTKIPIHMRVLCATPPPATGRSLVTKIPYLLSVELDRISFFFPLGFVSLFFVELHVVLHRILIWLLNTVKSL